MEKGCTYYVVCLFLILIVIAIIGPYLLMALVVGVIGLIVYFVAKQMDESWGIDADLYKVLAQAEEQKTIEVTPALSTTSVEWQESVITDSEWGRLEMKFVRDTEDGKLYIIVSSEPERAIVRMFINNNAPFKYLNYVSRLYGAPSQGQKENSKAVRHVREWVRRQILPELHTAKTHRELEYKRLAAKREAEIKEERRKREEERRKYLP